MHKLQNVVTVSDIPICNHPLKRKIHNVIKQLVDDGKLYIKPTKKNALIDFVASAPEMTSKAVTRQNILHGFRQNSLIDEKKGLYPDLNRILGTCRKSPTVEEYNLCITSFPYLFDEYLKYGFVSDKLFKQLGFPMDVDISGREVRRGSNIAQESRQRCKVLTHFHQVKLRQERKTIIQAEVRSKSADKKALLDLRLIDCISCETKMSRLMGNNDTREQSIRTNSTFEIISKCTGDELKAFIISSNFDLPKSRLPKMGKLLMQSLVKIILLPRHIIVEC